MLVGLHDLEPLASSVGDRLLQGDGLALLLGRKDDASAVILHVGDAQTPAGLLVQIQARSLLKRLDNLDFVVHNAEVALGGRVHSELVFDILVDASGLDRAAAAIVA